MSSSSSTDKNRSRKFWDEQAQRFEDHYPLIAQLLRDRGHSAWLAEECDRLTAELAAMKDECERLEQRAEDAVDTLNDEREEALLAPSSTGTYRAGYLDGVAGKPPTEPLLSPSTYSGSERTGLALRIQQIADMGNLMLTTDERRWLREAADMITPSATTSADELRQIWDAIEKPAAVEVYGSDTLTVAHVKAFIIRVRQLQSDLAGKER